MLMLMRCADRSPKEVGASGARVFMFTQKKNKVVSASLHWPNIKFRQMQERWLWPYCSWQRGAIRQQPLHDHPAARTRPGFRGLP